MKDKNAITEHFRKAKELIKKGEKDQARDEADYGLLRILNLRENVSWTYNSQSELYHHGIPGMKWGRRRGSTSGSNSSKKTSSMSDEELSSHVKRLSMEKAYNTLSKENKKTSGMEKVKKVVDATSNAVNQVKNLNKSSSQPKEKMNLSKMTDAQMRERINRANLEKQYNDMFAKPAKISKGQQYMSETLDIAGSVLAIGSSALGIAIAIKELKGK